MLGLEKSPKLDANLDIDISPEADAPFRKRKAVYYVVLAILVLSATWFVYKSFAYLSMKPGGLDGCIVDEHGFSPVATVSVDDISRGVYQDGCFFFAQLTPGKHQFDVTIDTAKVYTQNIEIISGEAVNLGTILLQP